jgi:hypothetical protein
MAAIGPSLHFHRMSNGNWSGRVRLSGLAGLTPGNSYAAATWDAHFLCGLEEGREEANAALLAGAIPSFLSYRRLNPSLATGRARWVQQIIATVKVSRKVEPSAT